MARDITRRSALGALGVGAAAAGAGTWYYRSSHTPDPLRAIPTALRPAGDNRIKTENDQDGSASWQQGADGTTVGDDVGHQVKLFASATSVPTGGSIDFHLALRTSGRVTVDVYRLGYYGGLGGRFVATSNALTAAAQPPPVLDDATGMITCPWPSTWTLRVPSDWTPGLHLAVATTADGHRNYMPFVVRDAEPRGTFLVVLPFTTYQAYNQYPYDGALGKSLYYGYGPHGTYNKAAHGKITYDTRARVVSFDRPYAVSGLPLRFNLDQDSITWLEMLGYDLSYASSLDLHDGSVDPRRFRAVISSGHDEYYSGPMRATVEQAVGAGVHAAYLTANNIYWHIRFSPAADGRPNRVMTCYKTDPDPAPDATGPTCLWRDIHPEQAVLGVQYNGIVAKTAPLVVQAPGHWFWAGTGVETGTQLPRLVGGEGDGLFPELVRPTAASQVLLSASPFVVRSGGTQHQNTSLYQAPSGAWVFDAGTFNWPVALNEKHYVDTRVQRATANLLSRLVQPPA